MAEIIVPVSVPAAATTVTGPDAYGATAAVGAVTTEFALADHNHGLPAAPADVPLSGGTMTGELVVPDLSVSGITGATAASRYVGATTSGAPTTGTFAVGDFVIDQTGKVWVCTTAGTPGTWTGVGGSSLSVLSAALGGVSIPGTDVATTVASFTVAVGTYLLNASCGFYSTVATTSLYQIALQGVVGTATASYAPASTGLFGQVALRNGAAANEYVVASGSQVITVTVAGTFLIQALSNGAVSTNNPQSTATMLKIV